MLAQEYECITCLKMYEDSETAVILECDECKLKAAEEQITVNNIRWQQMQVEIERVAQAYQTHNYQVYTHTQWPWQGQTIGQTLTNTQNG